MSQTDLHYLPAHRALEMFRAKTLSPVEHLQAMIDRADEVEPKVNAFTYTYFDEAMSAARAAEEKYASGQDTRPLEGLAIGIKDESDVKGKHTSNGSLLLKDNIATSTSPMNEHIFRAGGIMHARTATPEFSGTVITNSKLWGVTRNPWNLSQTPGGSSGGSSASLASGTSALCTGSDIGGSIRVPSSTCGLYGLKPTYGRNPTDSPFNLDGYAVDGPMARTAKDMILLQNAMCGPHPKDIVSLRPKLEISTELQSIKGWKIAYSPDLGFYNVSDEVRRNTEAALDVLREAGAIVEQVDLSWTIDVLQGAMGHLNHLMGTYLAPMAEKDPDLLMPYTQAHIENAKKSTAAKFLHAAEVENGMYSKLSKIFADYRLLVCPTTGIPSVPADGDGVTDEIFINGNRVHPLTGWVLTLPFNMLCRCPVVSAPSGISSSGVPTGIQIVGHTYSDQDVCRAAMAYEHVRGSGFCSAQQQPAL
ncbi:amidase [Leisingera sp. ANG-Vp]|uniref:amidase n=1 Tax=Leisingera sp. ANG-Vp TaxID=1577896 RepID=UPI00057D6524|nr:amidase [Leisingera sp. ANG-Vp]KIC20141.1 amidase [Leisingera sp. ANG-Vp]